HSGDDHRISMAGTARGISVASPTNAWRGNPRPKTIGSSSVGGFLSVVDSRGGGGRTKHCGVGSKRCPLGRVCRWINTSRVESESVTGARQAEKLALVENCTG